MSLNQLYVFLIFIVVGIIIGILFDIFRILRRSFKTGDFITYIEDFLFWILSGFILLFSIFTFNNGELRSFIFIGIILGAIFYLLLFSKYFINIFVKIITTIKKILSYPINLIMNFTKKYIIIPINIYSKRFYSKIHKTLIKDKNKQKVTKN